MTKLKLYALAAMSRYMMWQAAQNTLSVMCVWVLSALIAVVAVIQVTIWNTV